MALSNLIPVAGLLGWESGGRSYVNAENEHFGETCWTKVETVNWRLAVFDFLQFRLQKSIGRIKLSYIVTVSTNFIVLYPSRFYSDRAIERSFWNNVGSLRYLIWSETSNFLTYLIDSTRLWHSLF